MAADSTGSEPPAGNEMTEDHDVSLEAKPGREYLHGILNLRAFCSFESISYIDIVESLIEVQFPKVVQLHLTDYTTNYRTKFWNVVYDNHISIL